MKLITAENPERYAVTNGNTLIMLQVEEDNTFSITQSKQSKRAKSKVKVLDKGDIEDFCSNYKGIEEHNQMNICKAFENYLTEQVQPTYMQTTKQLRNIIKTLSKNDTGFELFSIRVGNRSVKCFYKDYSEQARATENKKEFIYLHLFMNDDEYCNDWLFLALNEYEIELMRSVTDNFLKTGEMPAKYPA